MAKKRKSLTRGLSQEFSRRASGEVTRRRDFAKSQALSNLERLLPQQLRWMFSYLRSFRPDFEAFQEEEEALPETEVVAEARRQVPKAIEPLYAQYDCVARNPLSCDRAQTLGFKYCQQCGFPAILLEKAEIRGNKGRYRIEGLLEQRGLGRLYQGIQVSDNQPVLIKEYLLPERYFNPEETRLRKQVFERVAGLSLADGRVQDFRLIHPWDAIADANEERCYLVTKGSLQLYPPLSEYLALHGPMSSRAARQVLNQVLQTLECLHGQKFRFPSGQIQKGLAHGNLTLNSLLIAQNSLPKINPLGTSEPSAVAVATPPVIETDFFIYTTDLAVWEQLFNPENQEIVNPLFQKDLVDLGYVAFYLLAGQTIHPISRHPLNPRDEQQWPPIDLPLQAYLQRLMGISVPFESAEAARQALLKLPIESAIALPISPIVEAEPIRSKNHRLWWFLLGILGVILLGWLIWLFALRSQRFEAASESISLCCIADVAAVPAGTFNYTAERQGTWQYVLQEENLIARGQTLEQELTAQLPRVQLNYQSEPSGEAAIEKVRTGESDFAISSLTHAVTPDLNNRTIAYDGIVVFVNFSYARRQQSLPNALRGQISFENLQKLYTGEVTNWRQIGGPDLPVRLYIPQENEVVQIFEQRVLQTESRINQFRNLIVQENPSDSIVQFLGNPAIRRLQTFPMLRQVIQDFENEQVGAIAFATLSKVFGQCSVYPLAIASDNQPPIQPLIQNNNRPITPATDLCQDKGNYRPNSSAFRSQTYPLAYPIAVIYPRDNSRPPIGRKFADILSTQEGQQLLKKTGLIPVIANQLE